MNSVNLSSPVLYSWAYTLRLIISSYKVMKKRVNAFHHGWPAFSVYTKGGPVSAGDGRLRGGAVRDVRNYEPSISLKVWPLVCPPESLGSYVLNAHRLHLTAH